MGRFAFMIHPLDLSELARMYRFTRYLPARVSAWLAPHIPPVTASPVRGVVSEHDGSTAEGWLVGCPLTAEQLLQLPPELVLNRIIHTGRLAQRAGAQILGLGGLTSVVGDAGITVAENLDIAVTTGHSFSIGVALEATQRAARLMGIDPGDAEVLVLGATGTTGKVVSELVARHSRFLTLVGRDESKLRSLADHIRHKLGLAASIATDARRSLARADIIVSVSDASNALGSARLRPGAVVSEVLIDSESARDICRRRDDVLVLQGGGVRFPAGVRFPVGTGHCGTAPAAIAETAVLALEDRFEDYTLGKRLSVDQVDQISKLARKHGFGLGGILGIGREVTEAAIDRIRKTAVRKRALLAHAGLKT